MTCEQKNPIRQDLFKKINVTVSNFSPGKELQNMNLKTEEKENSKVKESREERTEEIIYEEITKRSISVPSIYTVPISSGKLRDLMRKEINEEKQKIKNELERKSKNKFSNMIKLGKILYKNNASIKKLNSQTDDLMIRSEFVNNRTETPKGNNSEIKSELFLLPLKYQINSRRIKMN
jgi:hypothetical protein